MPFSNCREAGPGPIAIRLSGKLRPKKGHETEGPDVVRDLVVVSLGIHGAFVSVA